MNSRPAFLQGAFPFSGGGFDRPADLDADLTYVVPPDRRSQLIYFRAGNSSAELIYVTMLRDGAVMRLFPVGARSHLHVQLAVVEDLLPATRLGLQVMAPHGVGGTLVLDIGFLEII